MSAKVIEDYTSITFSFKKSTQNCVTIATFSSAHANQQLKQFDTSNDSINQQIPIPTCY